MRPRDTSPEAWKVLMDLMRKMSPEEKLQRTFEFSAIVRKFGEAGLRQKYPQASDREIFLRAAQRQTRRRFVREGLRRRTAAMMDPLATGLNELTAALTALGIRYLVGGSLASSAHGVWRATLDGDLVAAHRPAPGRSACPSPRDQAGTRMWNDASRRLAARRSFNLIHIQQRHEVGRVPCTRPISTDSELERAKPTPLRIEGAGYPARSPPPKIVCSPNCTGIADGGAGLRSPVERHQAASSSRIRISIGTYVNSWAARLRVADLLDRARADAEL